MSFEEYLMLYPVKDKDAEIEVDKKPENFKKASCKKPKTKLSRKKKAFQLATKRLNLAYSKIGYFAKSNHDENVLLGLSKSHCVLKNCAKYFGTMRRNAIMDAKYSEFLEGDLDETWSET